jgi:hypothetical protein
MSVQPIQPVPIALHWFVFASSALTDRGASDSSDAGAVADRLFRRHLVTDLANWQTTDVMWETFSAWLLTGRLDHGQLRHCTAMCIAHGSAKIIAVYRSLQLSLGYNCDVVGPTKSEVYGEVRAGAKLDVADTNVYVTKSAGNLVQLGGGQFIKARFMNAGFILVKKVVHTLSPLRTR